MADPKTAGRCVSCRHWEPEEPEHNNPEVRRCRRVYPWHDATQWDENYEARQLTVDRSGDLAFAQDGSGYYACLLTRAEFGCVQWDVNRFAPP